ncbi:MAG: valine--tRNA ligase [Treponema sp.]|nr:MAG: valine--tRNA ligase [Treponema sp.]
MSEKLQAIELEKAYNPKDFEERIYAKWEGSDVFKPVKSRNAGSFVVVLPPPNVTGILHMGHGLDHVLQDVAVRYHRMCGDETLWLPGTDHAGIATQNVVEKRLKTEGKSRDDLGREAFEKLTWSVKDEHHAIITNQMRKIGDSVDWSKECFTLDEGVSNAVRHVFVDLYNKGLIYRGNYLVNWCPRCGTALADDEVEHSDKKGGMYHIYYELADGAKLPDGSSKLEIATTRPETLLGDTAIAVHPEDERYSSLVGKFAYLPLVNRKLPIVADTYVEREFGTGVVKITPAHDPNDWELGKRHNLEVLNILNEDGTLNEAVPEKYRGLSCEKARKAVIADLEEQGLFKECKKIKHSVGECYRCHSTIEPFLSKQWFVKMQPLAQKALNAWKTGEVRFYPKKWENTYSHWLENIRDWCISRQLWWGHRIPVWYCDNCGAETVSITDACECSKCKSKNIRRDPDVLDTWFSSWLWPFSTLGWPEKTEDLKRFYPTTTLVTGYDILFFWVARMIMAGIEFTGEVPFKHVNLHGLVRDKQGRKMSKSLGNGIDPIKIVDMYGADALKFTLSFMCAQGQDVFIDEDSFKFGSKFANKIWNASRYILSNLEGRKIVKITPDDFTELDRWIFHCLNKAASNVKNALKTYRYNDSAQTLYEFFWNDFCDWYVEATKLSMKNGDEAEKDRAISVLLAVLEIALRLLHPHLPFITEEIYSKLPELSRLGGKSKFETLVTAEYPEFDPKMADEKAAAKFAALQEIVRNIRALRRECGIDPQLKIKTCLFVEKGSDAEESKNRVDIIKMLAGLAELSFINSPEAKPAGAIGTVGIGFEAFIITGEEIDAQSLLERFEKEVEKEKSNAQKLSGKLNNQKFIQNAPEEVVSAEKDKLTETERRIKKLSAYIQELSSRK